MNKNRWAIKEPDVDIAKRNKANLSMSQQDGICFEAVIRRSTIHRLKGRVHA